MINLNEITNGENNMETKLIHNDLTDSESTEHIFSIDSIEAIETNELHNWMVYEIIIGKEQVVYEIRGTMSQTFQGNCVIFG